MGLIPEDVIRQVIDRCDIVDVVSSYVPLKRAGQNFKALSPFTQEKTPSFIVSPQKQIFHCFSTGIGGNVIGFVMRMERMSFPEAVRMLADRCGVVIPQTAEVAPETIKLTERVREINAYAWQYFHNILLSDKRKCTKLARDYLKKRKFSLEMVKQFRIGFTLDGWEGLLCEMSKRGVRPKELVAAGLAMRRQEGEGFYDRFRNRIMFPIFDVRGRCVAFGGRTMEKDNSAKYINSPDTPVYTKGRHLYGLDMAKDAIVKQDRIVVVEGYMDVIMPAAYGFKTITASLGTALTQDQIRLLKRYTKNVVMLFDADPAGESAMSRSLDLLVEEGLTPKVVVLPDGQDPDSMVRDKGIEAFSACIDSALNVIDFKLNFLVEQFGKDSVEGRSKIASEMLKTVNGFRDPIARTEAVQKLARVLTVVQNAMMTEHALLEELNRLAADGRTPEVKGINLKPKKIDETLHAAERTLFQLILTIEDCAQLASQELSADMFVTQMGRHIAQQIVKFLEGAQDISPALLVEKVEDETAARILTGLIASGDIFAGNPQRVFEDCVERLKSEQLRAQRRQIIMAMEKAREEGDEGTLDTLTRQFNTLIKG